MTAGARAFGGKKPERVGQYVSRVEYSKCTESKRHAGCSTLVVIIRQPLFRPDQLAHTPSSGPGSNA